MKTLALVLALLTMGGTAMARDGNIQAPKRPEQPTTAQEEFWASEEGQWIDQQWQRFQNGEITLEQAQDAYEQKFGKPDYSPKQPSPPLLQSVPQFHSRVK